LHTDFSPWYASSDLAFHAILLALVDPDFAKEQLLLLLREWYKHPNGELPACEWNFSDANLPVHVWSRHGASTESSSGNSVGAIGLFWNASSTNCC
jgi:hypothetical protein